MNEINIIPIIQIPQELIQNLCLNDTPVLKMELSSQTKLLEIFVRGSVIQHKSEILRKNNNSAC